MMIVFPGMSGYEVDKRAYQIIRSFQPEVLTDRTIFDVERFVDLYLEGETGVDPDYSYELPEGVYGLTDSGNNRMVINADLAEDINNERFFRSTLAHEVGHCLLHVPFLRARKVVRVFKQLKDEEGKIRLYREEPIPIYKNPEWQAHRFAGALLMPEQPVLDLVQHGASIRDVAGHFHVNIRFVESRMRALKMEI